MIGCGEGKGEVKCDHVGEGNMIFTDSTNKEVLFAGCL